MDKDAFWAVVGAARVEADRAGTPVDQVLREDLRQRSREEIQSFQKHFDDAQNALYRWDVWGAAYLIGGGCSDDAFMDFRAGVISFGREWFDRVRARPDSLAQHPAVRDADEFDEPDGIFLEEVNYAAMTAFEEVAGDDQGFRVVRDEREANLGESFDFDDDDEMRRRYPALSELVLGTN